MDDDVLIEQAARLAVYGHAGQKRAVRGDPYIGHVFAVAAIVAEYGGDAEQIAAALVHDIVEDTDATIDVIRYLLGERVAKIVAALTEPEIRPYPGYKARKQAYVEQLRNAPIDALLVALGDKTHNLETTLRNIEEGHDMLARFPSVGWYSSLLLAAFSDRAEQPDAPGGLTRLFVRYRLAVVSLSGVLGRE